MCHHPAVLTDHVEKRRVFRSRDDVTANLTKLGEGVEIFICYAPDPDDPYSDPDENVAVTDQHEQKIWSLIHDLKRHGFYVSSDLNMPGAPDSIILRWVTALINLSEYVILVCSPAPRELVTASSLSEKVKDVRARRLFKYRNAIYGVMEWQMDAVTKLVSVILDGRYDNQSSAPCTLSSGHIYRLCEVASPRQFDYDCKNGEFEKLGLPNGWHRPGTVSTAAGIELNCNAGMGCSSWLMAPVKFLIAKISH